MNLIRDHWLRPALWLVIGCGWFGLPIFGHAQTVTVTPAAPEAFQPFTLTGIECVPRRSMHTDEHGVGISTEDRRIHAPMWPADECSPAVSRVINIPGLPAGVYQVFNIPEIDFIPPMIEIGTVAIAPAPPIQPVFAFYNQSIKHYFITASVAEKDSLLNSGGGGGWGIVDGGFNAWPADGPAPAAARPVCRFYSSLVNSHFYTAGTGECELLKQPGSGWTYEGIAFRALVPTKGSCYPGTFPVWRLYNDRFAQVDSNHRFVNGADTYRHMMANGWIGEGVAFCSPEF
jgi:hypothetical protein